jgi:hypothetical protein
MQCLLLNYEARIEDLHLFHRGRMNKPLAEELRKILNEDLIKLYKPRSGFEPEW